MEKEIGRITETISSNKPIKEDFVRAVMMHCDCNTVFSRRLYSGGVSHKHGDSYADVC